MSFSGVCHRDVFKKSVAVYESSGLAVPTSELLVTAAIAGLLSHCGGAGRSRVSVQSASLHMSPDRCSSAWWLSDGPTILCKCDLNPDTPEEEHRNPKGYHILETKSIFLKKVHF